MKIIRFLAGRAILIVLPVCLFFGQAKAQNTYYDSLLNATLAQDSLFLDELMSDSLSLIKLIDSLINLPEPSSYLSARISYTSDIAYAGRNFGVNQYGFSSGLSYYHKSGIYGDVTGYWNSNSEPKYNPTILSLGYLGYLGKNISYMTYYDHYFYQKPEENDLAVSSYPLTNSVSTSGYYDLKYLSLGADYSFLFGEETAHRVRANIIGRFRWYKKGIFDRISFSPGVSMLAGNQNIYTISQSYQFTISSDEFKQILIDKYGYDNLVWLKARRPRLYQRLITREALNYAYLVEEQDIDNVFGIMNYSVSVPLYLTINKLTFAISYNVNFPVSLPGENIKYDPNSYFNVSLLYDIFFK